MTTVARLSVTPVKSLALHHPEEVVLERCGVARNRRFYLVREDGRLLAGVHHGPLVEVRADWDETAERLRLAFPDGSVVEDEVRLGEPLSTDFWGHRVRGRLVLGPWARPLSAFAGRPVRLVKADEPGGGVDVDPVTLVSLESRRGAREPRRPGGAGGPPLPHARRRSRLRAARGGLVDGASHARSARRLSSSLAASPSRPVEPIR
jgi:hypothetical protein